MGEYVTIKDIALRASLSEKTVRKFIKRGKIPCYRPQPRGKMLIRWRDFEVWIESRRVRIEADADAKEMLEILFFVRGFTEKRESLMTVKVREIPLGSGKWYVKIDYRQRRASNVSARKSGRRTWQTRSRQPSTSTAWKRCACSGGRNHRARRQRYRPSRSSRQSGNWSLRKE